MVLIDDDPYFLMTWSNGNETYQRLEGDDLDYFLDNQVLQCVQKRIDPEEREHSLEEQKRKEERSTAEENKNVEDEARRKFNVLFAQNFISGNIRREREQAERNRHNARDLIEIAKDMPNIVKRLYPPPSPPPQPKPADKVTISSPTIFIPPLDEFKKVLVEIKADEKEVKHTLLKAVLEHRREKDEKSRERLRIFNEGLEKRGGLRHDGTPVPGGRWDPESENCLWRRRRRK